MTLGFPLVFHPGTMAVGRPNSTRCGLERAQRWTEKCDSHGGLQLLTASNTFKQVVSRGDPQERKKQSVASATYNCALGRPSFSNGSRIIHKASL